LQPLREGADTVDHAARSLIGSGAPSLPIGAGPPPDGSESPCDGCYRALYHVIPGTGRVEIADDVQVLPVFGPGQDRGTI
jgi:hypothetical protein